MFSEIHNLKIFGKFSWKNQSKVGCFCFHKSSRDIKTQRAFLWIMRKYFIHLPLSRPNMATVVLRYLQNYYYTNHSNHSYCSITPIPNIFLTLSWRRPLSYRNQSIDLQTQSINWFLHDNGLRHERVKADSTKYLFLENLYKQSFADVLQNWRS